MKKAPKTINPAPFQPFTTTDLCDLLGFIEGSLEFSEEVIDILPRLDQSTEEYLEQLEDVRERLPFLRKFLISPEAKAALDNWTKKMLEKAVQKQGQESNANWSWPNQQYWG